MKDAEVKRIKRRLKELDDNGVPAWETPRGRILATMYDPAAFAYVYLKKHITDTDGKVSFSEVHLEWIEAAKRWTEPVGTPGTERDAFIAPRSMGKSTWWFLIFPLWSAAMGHVKFAAAFADSGAQAEAHLSTFKSELDRNTLLQQDFPDLCKPLTRPRSGSVVADNRNLLQASNGFVFTARGVDAGHLGMKIGDTRPDVIICDDLEPGESNYSAYQAGKRLTTLLDDILPLNVQGRAVLVGTTTMTGSVTDQLRLASFGLPGAAAWVRDENFRVHFTPAIAIGDDGERRSIWPQKWSLPFLESIEHTRQYAKNYALQPIAGGDGDYWRDEDFTRGDLEGVTRILVSVDPAVTTKQSSDFTGVSVIGYAPASGKCIVYEARQVKLAGEALRLDVIRAIERWDAGLILVETNQGGDLWGQIFHHMPVKTRQVHQKVKKEVRAADVLMHYQRGRVIHYEKAKLADLEAQMIAFPNVPHDDMVDATGSAIAAFLDKKPKRIQAGGVAMSYA